MQSDQIALLPFGESMQLGRTPCKRPPAAGLEAKARRYRDPAEAKNGFDDMKNQLLNASILRFLSHVTAVAQEHPATNR